MLFKKLKLFIGYLFFCIYLPAFADTGAPENFYFTIISGESGLSHNNVKSIIQDSWGFMWFGTRNRLNRYDGTSIKVFDCYDPVLKKRNNNVAALFEDRNKELWVGTDKGIYIYNPMKENFRFFNDSTSQNLKIEDWVADIQSDADGNIWIVIPNQGLFRYNQSKQKLHHYQLGKNLLPDQGTSQSICIEQSGRVWIGTNGSGVYLYNQSTDSFTQYLGDKNGSSLQGENIYTMCDYGEELVVGIHEGKLRKLNKRKNTLTDVNSPDVHYQIIRHVVCYDNELWVGTQSGLYIINELEKKTSHVYEDPMNPHSLSDNLIEKIYRDREKGIWLVTNFGGVNYLPNKGISFKQYIPLSSPGSVSSKRVRELKEDNNGNIWVGTEDAGLNRFNVNTKLFSRIGKDVGSSLNYNQTLGLLLDNNKIWVGLFKNGLDIVQLPEYSVKHYSSEQLGLNEASIYAICEDRNGKIWLGNAWGVFKGDKTNMKFERINAFGFSYIFDIMEDSEGFIWVATMGNGVFRHDQSTQTMIHYTNEINNYHSLSSNSVSSITEDSKGNIWFSTDRGGICKFDKKNDRFTSFSIKDGLPDDISYKILEDKQYNLWFGTNKGLVKFNPESREIRVFAQNNGLPCNQFNYKSALAASTGEFYFGGMEGLISFNPYEFKDNPFIPPVFITKLTVYNKEMEIDSTDSPLKKSIIHTPKITLNYNQANIGFDFVALSYTAPLANKYAYKMEGIDRDWTYTTNNHSASYAKLPPGNYTFRVKGSNNDGLWNEDGTSISIEILPPWWRSSLAYTVYIILILTILYCWFEWYKRKQEKRHAEKQRLFETEKEKELYSAKLEFFTDIAHEVRTPLTLINGPLEALQEMEIPDPEIKKNLHIMGKNTSQLLDLINQLLDFRKVDSKKLSLNFSMVNISDVIRDKMMQFEPTAIRKKRKIRLLLPEDPVIAPVDKEEFIKILNNLFSNAIKYSSEQIDVMLSVTGNYFTIIIQNDGELIPQQFHEKIFEPFYQLKKDQHTTSSSGIGLSLVRSLVELHQGTIHLDTQSGMNRFIIQLPCEQKSMAKTPDNDVELAEYCTDHNEHPVGKNGKETVLVVEDNPEMLSFIADKLQDTFFVEKASSGNEALDIVNERPVDIILSDVMMPGMDGFELCRQLKLNIEYSHIPIVLLTAKNDLPSKIQGLEMGAEAYIEKPFSSHFLITQLTTLLNNRQREREAFRQKPFLPVQQMGMNKADEKFMNRIIEIIHQHITDPNLNVEWLAESVFMSRSSLHRKIKALSGTAPTDFIRLIRLKKAAELIQGGEYRIGEVCYLVGINSSSYFIKLFQKQFGMTPKEFEKDSK